MNYTELKKKALEKYFSRSNNMQKKAIFKTQGPVLIIAGAGSGKTTVLCNRIANLLLFGDAYESTYEPELGVEDRRFLEFYADGKYDGISSPEIAENLSRIIGHRKALPWKILAVTFTNKAAAELKERLSRMNAPAEDVWAATFHSTCVRILRRSIGAIGYAQNFVIYDTDDTKRIIKAVLDSMNISERSFDPKTVANSISRAKDKLIYPESFPVEDVGGKPDFRLGVIRDIYAEYQKRLKAANALDFDDIIMKTVEVFTKDKEALDYWQSHFDYIMVDEYQDTNVAQYILIKMLAGEKKNLCAVGDEDQSIYKFRGATIENILSFEKEFSAEVIKLEQNYRSTSTILDAANAVIKNNTQHKDKRLWSDLGEGEKIKVVRFPDEQAESLFVANEILSHVEKGGKFADNAILYRSNAQSRSPEITLGKMSVPYKIVGGTRFYERKEIRDAIAYLSVICNPYDTVRLARIINEPRRGIGDVTVGEIENTALSLGLSPIEVMERCEEFAALSKKAKALKPLAAMFRELSDAADERDMTELLDEVIERSGYKTMLMTQGEEGVGRLENIKELKSSMVTFMEENEESTLFDFLEQAALISDLDSYDTETDRVTLMTIHSAKGLEFENVFIIGAEENLFPSYRSLMDMYELEEDRRLCYVAITRAKKKLYMTNAKSRLLYGQTQYNGVSRFIEEIPAQYVDFDDKTKRTPAKSVPIPKPKQQTNYLKDREVKVAAAKRAEPADFSRGDRVKHKVFGEGTVISASPVGNDTLLEISFDKPGTKKIMANFAKLEKI